MEEHPPRYFLVTQTYVQATYYTKELGLPRKQVITPHPSLGFAGLKKREGDKVLFRGTYQHRRDYEVLIQQLRAAGFTDEELYNG